MAHILNLDRRLADQVESLRRGKWQRLEFAKGSRGLYGNTLAILGVGHIGREVIKQALAFGMKVKALDPMLTEEEARNLGVRLCNSVTEAVKDSYVLCIHLPLNKSTKGLVNKEVLAKLQSGALVVNMSRGGILDESALLSEIEKRGLRAGLDVFNDEPNANDKDFQDESIMNCNGIYGTHHTGARTDQAALAVDNAVVDAIRALTSDEPVPGSIS
eukprot:TRINITY_DN35399_c0_g1_i1.p1 TRINITY_DN35399_c0_g1~~TRINITY_DN35399_c0_g1_i1.p1  ORF type:complete len:243 (+),score=65.91 TRINITY_DN35399_c0_g1_i1:84-731(+)